MKNSFIRGISYYLPKNILTNQDLEKEFPEWSSAKIFEKIGIDQRHIADEAEFVSDMAASAANMFFEEYSFDRNDVDYLIICTQSPDHFLPTTACIVHEKLHLKKACAAIDFNQGCAGYIHGLSLAKGLIATETAKNVLLITAETYSKFLNKTDKSNRSIFGDAAAATLISDTGILAVNNFAFGSDGKGVENLIVKNGAIKHDKTGDKIDDFLYMNGTEIFNFTLDVVPDLLSELTQKNDLEKEEVDIFIFHQANTFLLNHLRKKLSIPEEKFFISMRQTGNTVSCTIPIALKNFLVQNEVPKTLALVGFGVGYSWGGVILNA